MSLYRQNRLYYELCHEERNSKNAEKNLDFDLQQFHFQSEKSCYQSDFLELTFSPRRCFHRQGILIVKMPLWSCSRISPTAFRSFWATQHWQKQLRFQSMQQWKVKAFNSLTKWESLIQAFPKLTICLNSQQSISKIKKNYPDKYEEILAGLPFLYGSYGDNHGERFRDFRRKDRSTLGIASSFQSIMFISDKLDLDKFMNDTNGDMEIIACKFLNRDCRHSWASVKTIYGTCLVFNPLSEHWKTMKQKSLFGRQSSISFSVKWAN